MIKFFDFKGIKEKAFSIHEIFYFLFLIIYIYIIASPISNNLQASMPIITFHQLNIIEALSILIIAPVVEEILFRIHLSGKKKHIWAIFLMVLSSVFMLIPDLFVWILIIILLFGGFFLLYYEEISSILAGRFFNHLFYFSSVLFAMVHFHQVDANHILIKILVIIMFFFPLGIYFGYMRKRYGLASSILAHSFYNLSVLVINSLVYSRF